MSAAASGWDRSSGAILALWMGIPLAVVGLGTTFATPSSSMFATTGVTFEVAALSAAMLSHRVSARSLVALGAFVGVVPGAVRLAASHGRLPAGVRAHAPVQ